MTWFRVDDSFPRHPKVLGMPRAIRPAAVGLWTLAGGWSASQLTDGFVPAYMVAELGCTDRVAAALVSATLWSRVCNGYQFHDWSDYNPTRAHVEAERESARQRMKRRRSKTPGSPDVRANTTRTNAEVQPQFGSPDPTLTSYGSYDARGHPHPGAREAAGRLVSEYRATLKDRRRPDVPGAVAGRLVDQTASLLAEGVPERTLRQALVAWDEKGLAAGALPTVVHELQRPRRGGQPLDMTPTHRSPTAAEQCQVPGHSGWAENCAQCRSEQKGLDPTQVTL